MARSSSRRVRVPTQKTTSRANHHDSDTDEHGVQSQSQMKQRHAVNLDALSEDEVEQLDRERRNSRVQGLDVEDEESEDEEEAVFDLTDESEEDEEDDSGESENDESDQAESDDEENVDAPINWGKKKSAYYDGDDSTEESDMDQEARRLQQQHLANLSDDDFVDEHVDALIQQEKEKESLKQLQQQQGEILNNLDLTQLLMDEEEEDEDVARESAVTDEEKLKKIMKDSPELVDLLNELNEKMTELKEHLQPLLEKLRAAQVPLSQGVSFLQVKYQLLLSYCSHIAFYLLLKCEGRSVQQHPVIEALVKCRLYLERMKPVELRLKYQIDKLIKASISGKTSFNDPMQFKPNLEALTKTDENENDEEMEQDTTQTVYKPPQFAPMHFEEGSQKQSRLERQEQRLKDRAARSRLLQDLRQELSEKPEEIQDDQDDNRHSNDKLKNKLSYEEDNFMRFTLSKKELSAMRGKQKRHLVNDLAELDDFQDLAHLNNGKKNKLEQAALSVHKSHQKNRRNRSDDEEAVMEDPLYEKVRQVKRAKQEARDALHQPKPVQGTHYDEMQVDPNEKRPASYQILKNKGLTPYRSKAVRNPRVKQRQRFDAANKKLSSVRAVYQAGVAGASYAGEKTGIKTNLARSVKF